jgi:peptide/nickel transport system substrate-binding protein
MSRSNRSHSARGAVFLAALLLLPELILAQGVPGRPGAPPRPSGEYTWTEPADWTPPTLEELQSWDWQPGRVTTGREVAAERAKTVSPLVTVEQALSMINDKEDANRKMASALTLPPASLDAVDWDATVNRWISGAPGTLNPLLQSSKYEQETVSMFTAGFMTFDHDMLPYADGEFAREWRRTPLADMIILRDDVTWEDGTPFTAYDAELSYHAIMDDRISIPAVRAGTDELKWVKAYDAHTIVYFHKEALVTNVWNVNHPMIPKHIYSPGLAEDPTMRASEWNVYWNLNPLAGAAYKLVEHQTNQFLIFERREDWYQKDGKQIRDKPYVKRYRFRIIPDHTAALLAFKKGEIDEMLLNARQWEKETSDADFNRHGVRLNDYEWTYAYIGWNMKPIPDVPFFKDRRVRLAMTYALDHEEMHKGLFFNLYDPGTGQFHPRSWMHNAANQPFKQDLDKAEELLEEAGWVDTDRDGIRDQTIDGKKWKFEFTMLVPQGGTGDKIAILLKESLDSIGVRMNIKLLEWATYQQHVYEHRFEASTAAWGTGVDPDTSKNIWKTEMYDGGRNYVGYSNPKVDELFEAGAREFDFEKRKAIYQEIDRLIYEDQPYTFLYFRRTFWAFNKRLRGYYFSPREPFGFTPGLLAVWVPKGA